MLICLIEDNARLRSALTLTLQDRGYDVCEADNGEIGLEVAKARHPDIVVTDLQMPRVDGMTVIQELRAEFPGLPIVAMSGGGERALIDGLAQALRRGADRAISKPFVVDELINAMRDALNARDARD